MAVWKTKSILLVLVLMVMEGVMSQVHHKEEKAQLGSNLSFKGHTRALEGEKCKDGMYLEKSMASCQPCHTVCKSCTVIRR